MPSTSSEDPDDVASDAAAASKRDITEAMQNRDAGASDYKKTGDGSGTGPVATAGDVGGDLTMENAQVDPFAKWYTFIAEYDFFTTMQLSTVDSIFDSAVYSYYAEYYGYDDAGTVDLDAGMRTEATQSADFTPVLTAEEMTVVGYNEWSVINDFSSYNRETTEPLVDTASTSQYQTYGVLDDPTLKVESADEYKYSLTYSTDEENGLKNRFGIGQIDTPSAEIKDFFESTAETLYNTMNVSRFNFKRTDSPMIKNTNLSAIGTVAVGSAFVDVITDTGGL